MDKDKKIEIQQQELLRLDKENEDLKQQIGQLNNQIEHLKGDLTVEKEKPKDGYERAKQMIRELEIKQAEYIEIIDSLKELREKYDTEILELQRIKEKYQEKVVSTIWDIKHSIDAM